MKNKISECIQSAVNNVVNGSSVMVGGFGQAGTPFNLVDALVEKELRNLVIICNSISQVASLVENRCVARLISSFPVWVDRSRPNPLDEQIRTGVIKVEIVPQGTLAERIRAGGVGIGAFYAHTGVGTVVEEGKEKRGFEGSEYLLEYGLKADIALIKAFRGDKNGNLVYNRSARNYNPIMAMGSRFTIVEVEEIVPESELAPEAIITPGLLIDLIIKTPKKGQWMYKN
ncbi:CoA transferase subunit A [Chloroflexota bacterium]